MSNGNGDPEERPDRRTPERERDPSAPQPKRHEEAEEQPPPERHVEPPEPWPDETDGDG